MTEAYENAPTMTEATRGRLLMAGRALVAVVIVGALTVAALDNWDRLRHVELHLRPAWLVAAAPFTLAGGLLLPLAWRHVLFAYGQPIGRRAALRVWCVSQASRFVPGNVAQFASRVLLASRIGVSRRIAGVSLLVEAGLILAFSGVFASWLPSSTLASPLRALLAAGSIAVLLATPWLLRLVHRLVPVGEHRVRHLYEAEVIYGVNDIVRSIGFVLVTAAVHHIAGRDVFLVIAAVNAGVAVGMVGITPAGLGVREGVIAAVLSPRFGPGTALALAAVYRVWEFAIELVWLGAALRLSRRQRR
jgi:uncharacterized membrane protein YbhN (UPF0104 family)